MFEALEKWKIALSACTLSSMSIAIGCRTKKGYMCLFEEDLFKFSLILHQLRHYVVPSFSGYYKSFTFCSTSSNLLSFKASESYFLCNFHNPCNLMNAPFKTGSLVSKSIHTSIGLPQRCCHAHLSLDTPGCW